jgi:UDP-N-acetylmuramyl pentapeptide phosphotransferase/UDP-N-acetylglucosamine-1-phosphate transferase
MNVPSLACAAGWRFGGSFVISWLLTALLIRWAPRLRLVDYPNERKVHTRPTPRGGGIAIFVAVIAINYPLSG